MGLICTAVVSMGFTHIIGWYLDGHILNESDVRYHPLMDKSVYHATLKSMHEAGVAPEYYHGWASGALGNTLLEEQRITEGYTAGYEDGSNGETEAYKNWLIKTD